MNTYVLWSNSKGIVATVTVDIHDKDLFHKELHEFQCGNDFSDRSNLTPMDFEEYLNNKGYECTLVLDDGETYHWWLQD